MFALLFLINFDLIDFFFSCAPIERRRIPSTTARADRLTSARRHRGSAVRLPYASAG